MKDLFKEHDAIREAYQQRAPNWLSNDEAGSLLRIADEYRERIAVLEKTLTHSTSCLVSLRKNYEDDIPLWSDVSHAITEGNTALAREQEEGNGA